MSNVDRRVCLDCPKHLTVGADKDECRAFRRWITCQTEINPDRESVQSPNQRNKHELDVKVNRRRSVMIRLNQKVRRDL